MNKKSPVRIALTSEGNIKAYVEERARTSLPHIYHVTMPLQGRVLPITVEEGDEVKTGEIVVRLEDIDWQDTTRQVKDILVAVDNWIQASEAQVKANRIRQDFTKWEWEKNEILLKSASISERQGRDSKREYLDSTVKIEESQAMYHMSKAFQSMVELMPAYVKRNLDRTLVTSPVNGTVLKRHVWNEKVMTPGEPLLDIGNLAEMEVTADILSEEAVHIQSGDKVEIFGESVGGTPIQGSVRLVQPEAFTKMSSLGVEEQRVAVKIAFAEQALDALNQSGKTIGLHYRVRVRIITDEKPRAVVVPRTSLFRGMEGNWQIYRVISGRAELTNVEVGLMNDHQAEILSGVRVGETVIVAPESSISDGSRVAAIE
ncbi:MAG: efflux RND transporter periplasmic adaptor subunit [Proteobacteria bacterium]|nr:efflux RND transporter periplasmic adaptor subunit [Pseudomonadota bacterium]MBU1231555.1 efflux RND transporter periplasmic adaptor subunit [Pseudomonadota bacterium]MBU1419226.1 efflux RND transporter periplasmic adaptor subunit [Pseudomonadota bacterium]MBU1453854.1 efflux RND transporter periplasmic adaptor subunit [Pseudomonadota bacterium]